MKWKFFLNECAFECNERLQTESFKFGSVRRTTKLKTTGCWPDRCGYWVATIQIMHNAIC
jgi:hypothetical protein